MTHIGPTDSPGVGAPNAEAAPTAHEPNQGAGRRSQEGLARRQASAAPASPPTAPRPAKYKLGQLVALLLRDEGATIAAMMTATGWRAHPVRGAMDGAIRRELGLAVVSEMVHGERRYRIPAEPS